MNFLIVGGNFDDNGGRPSSLINKIALAIPKEHKVTVYNGGYYPNIENLLESTKNYDAVFWCPNIPNDKPKLRDVKSVNPKVMLITSKRNNDNQYTFQELINRALQTKSNLCVEFSKVGDQYKMMLFDPLGNAWYDGFDIKELAEAMASRTEYLKTITRKGCTAIDIPVTIPNNVEFFNVVKDYAEIFHHLIHPEEGVTRFLGNSSFREENRTRCERGFPSFRSDNGVIYVSRRNVDKRYIDKDNFVPTKLNYDGSVFYSGPNKPSVDTPIQLQLYARLPEINYMIHAHVYIDGAPFTEQMVPCGGLEEVEEVMTAIKNNYPSPHEDFYAINLIGHGCVVMSNKAEQLKNIPFVGRRLPEHPLKPVTHELQEDILTNNQQFPLI